MFIKNLNYYIMKHLSQLEKIYNKNTLLIVALFISGCILNYFFTTKNNDTIVIIAVGSCILGILCTLYSLKNKKERVLHNTYASLAFYLLIIAQILQIYEKKVYILYILPLIEMFFVFNAYSSYNGMNEWLFFLCIFIHYIYGIKNFT